MNDHDSPIVSERVFRVVPATTSASGGPVDARTPEELATSADAVPVILDGAQATLPNEAAPSSPKRPRGFAALSPAERATISARGGKAAHATGTAHRFTTDEAKAAGRKGGMAPKRRSPQTERAHQPTLPSSG